MTNLNETKQQQKELFIFAKNNGFDFDNATMEDLEELTKKWYLQQLEFHKAMIKTPMAVKKVMLGIN